MIASSLKRIIVKFYSTETGKMPALIWIKNLEAEDRRIIGVDLQILEYGWPIGMPLCRTIKSHKGLWEQRSHLTGKKIARLLFFISDGFLVVLHGFIKKTQKTPVKEIDIAVKRMKEVKKHEQK